MSVAGHNQTCKISTNPRNSAGFFLQMFRGIFEIRIFSYRGGGSPENFGHKFVASKEKFTIKLNLN